MVYWKIDEKTIRCLITKDELGQMGYDYNSLNGDTSLMSELIHALVQHSHNYLEWNTENGVQAYETRALPADQFLITISCSMPDEIFEKSKPVIRNFFKSIGAEFTEEQLNEFQEQFKKDKVEAEKNFTNAVKQRLAKKKAVDNQAVEEENDTVSQAEGSDKKRPFPDHKVVFQNFSQMNQWAALFDDSFDFPSKLYRYKGRYTLLIFFENIENKNQILQLLTMAEEFGAECDLLNHDEAFLQEHGDLLISENAIETLKYFA